VKALSALKALNHARRQGAPVASLQYAIDAADRSCGYDRSKNRPVRGPLPPLVPLDGNQTASGRPCRPWPHRSGCACTVCKALVRRRLGRLGTGAAFAVFDPRPVLRRCAQRGRTWGVFRYAMDDGSHGAPVLSIPDNPSRISNGSVRP
jgi:hypothetical protein